LFCFKSYSTRQLSRNASLYFEDPEDARWFFDEGYKRMLWKGERYPDSMTLWVDGQEVDNRVFGSEGGLEEG